MVAFRKTASSAGLVIRLQGSEEGAEERNTTGLMDKQDCFVKFLFSELHYLCIKKVVFFSPHYFLVTFCWIIVCALSQDSLLNSTALCAPRYVQPPMYFLLSARTPNSADTTLTKEQHKYFSLKFCSA